MARQQVVTAGPMAAASPTSLRTATTALAGPLILDGTFASPSGSTAATLDSARKITITTTDDQTANHFVVIGYGPGGANPITETITGANAGVSTSTLYYDSIVSITMEDSLDPGEEVSVGTAALGSSAWVQFDRYAMAGVAIQLTVSGTANWTLQQTLDDPNQANLPEGRSTITPATVTWVNSSDTAAVAASTTIQTNYMFPPAWARVILNSGTGTVTATFIQVG